MKIVLCFINLYQMVVHKIVQPQQIKKLLKCLCYNTYINTTSSIIWEDIDGCEEQYRCATDICLLSLLSHDFQIVID